MQLQILLLVTSFWRILIIDAYNYCHNSSHVCNVAQMKHFICNMDSKLRPLDGVAQYKTTVPDTPRFHKQVLEKLNSYRNQLASGKLMTNHNLTFPSASRMRELIWDAELAYMARIHAATVSFRHSECRSTQRFPMAGECLGLVGSTKDKHSIKSLLELTLLPMFEEYKEVEDPDDLIEAFNPVEHFFVGHFTVLISDRVSRVGCGIAIASNCNRGNPRGGYCHFITCHFDFTNLADSYIYKAGKPASKCSAWLSSVSPDYSNLCMNTGQIFDKNHGDDSDINQTRISNV